MRNIFALVLVLSLTACKLNMPMAQIDQNMFEGSTSSSLNYASRGELKSYAGQLIQAYKLDFYHIDRRWRIPPVNKLNANQKVVAYVLLDLKLATEDANYYNIVPEVSVYKRRDDVSKGISDYMSNIACISSFRTVCPEDNSIVVNVCVEQCARGGVINIQTTSAINDFEQPSEQAAYVEAIGLAMKNLFYKLSSNKPVVTSKTSKFHPRSIVK